MNDVANREASYHKPEFMMSGTDKWEVGQKTSSDNELLAKSQFVKSYHDKGPIDNCQDSLDEIEDNEQLFTTGLNSSGIQFDDQWGPCCYLD